MQKLEQKIKLKRYPYTYVRATVMKSLLFRKDDYQKMLKMSFSEIAKFLQESTYRKEINALATQYSGAELLELAMNKNLSDSFKKLMSISPDELRTLITAYILRKDIEDIKTILRGKFTGANEKTIIASLTGAGTLSGEELTAFLKKDSVEEILKSNRIVEFSLFANALKDFHGKKTLASIENVFDRQYYRKLAEFSQRLPKQGALFRNFLIKEVEVINLLTLLRLKKAKMAKDSFRELMIPTGYPAKDAKLMGLVSMEDIEEFARELMRTEYKELIVKGIEEYKKTNSLIKLETDLYKYLLDQTTLMLHQHPLSVDTILGYMFAKDIEVRNLKILVKGKQLGLKDEFIESQLVVD